MCPVFTMSLILWYKLNESDVLLGTDSSDSNIDATSGAGSYVDPTYGKVAYFDRGGCGLTIPAASVPAALYGGNSRTYSFWINTTLASSGSLVAIGNTNTAGRRSTLLFRRRVSCSCYCLT